MVIGALSILVGVGSGATLMPTTVAATRSLDGPELPQASTVLALFSQLGTALVASTITLLITARVDGLDTDGRGGLAAIVALEPAERAPLAHQLASTIGLSYATPATLILVAFVATICGMRSSAPERTSRQLIRWSLWLPFPGILPALNPALFEVTGMLECRRRCLVRA
ncbi:hypothetical protein [Nonomuraea sp. 10N515B]|uniref:hypothetical protein n=1 Tax=Nonomuraea sp. 10N515B TaxID=3457422 RepID=UPI003FCD828D